MSEALDKITLALLVCPQCKGRLVLVDTDNEHALICRGCRLSYPFQNNIPKLIISAATELSAADLEQLPK